MFIRKFASLSGKAWLQRQAKDIWAKRAQDEGLPSRSSFKLMQINQKHKIIIPKDGFCGVDLGCAPGGWLVVAGKLLLEKNKNIKLIGIDLLDVQLPSFVDELKGIHTIKGDFMQQEIIDQVERLLGKGKSIDLLMSDACPNHSGQSDLHHLRSMQLVRKAFELATAWKSRVFLCKVFNGSELNEFIQSVKRRYLKVQLVKPEASRKESSELYVLARC